MSNDNITRNPDGTIDDRIQRDLRDYQNVFDLDVVKTKLDPANAADLEKHYNPEEFMSTGFLQSSKFNAYFIFNQTSDFWKNFSSNAIFTDLIKNPQKFRFYCDSIEFPGSTLTATDYRVPGKMKVKIPYLRDLSEVNLTFYHPVDVPLYTFFNRWLREISPNSSRNQYFDDIVSEIVLNQFDNYSHAKLRPEQLPTETSLRSEFFEQFAQSQLSNSPTRMRKQFTLKLLKAYPLSVTSLQSNWADDGFHKINVSLFFEDIETTFDPGLNAVEHGLSRMLPAENYGRGQAALDRDVFDTIGE